MVNESLPINDAPIVGVLSTVRLSDNDGLPTGKEADIFIEKFAVAKQYGITIFLFYPENVDGINKSIKGYTYIYIKGSKGYWVRRTFPLPDIVYNRIRYRKVEGQSKVKHLLEKFDENPHIQLFNTRFLDKWEVYETLLKDPFTFQMVPPSKILSYGNLQSILDHGSEVFIKPRNNNAGRGIIKVIRKSPNIYAYSESQSTPPKWGKSNSFNNLWNHISFLTKQPDDYIVQTAIDLGRVNGQVFDLRAQVQKDGKGQWVFTGVHVRVAVKNRFVTFPKVGEKVSFHKAMNRIAKGSDLFRDKVKSQLADLYYYVPKTLEQNLGLSLAVLSIDIGIDVKGKPWIIEVSSKSDSFTEKAIRKQHYQFLMEYMLHVYRERMGGN